MAAYQIAFMERIPASAAVFAAVAQVKKSRAAKLSGLVNALLRALAKMPKSTLVPSEVDDDADLASLSLRLGLPSWLFARIARALGRENAITLCQVFNRAARRTLRINLNHISPGEALRALGDEAAIGTLSPFAVDVQDARLARALVEKGFAAYQDEAAQLAVLALGLPDPEG